MHATNENILNIGFALVQKLGVKVTRSYFRLEMETHPEYPALSALVDTYFSLGINNLAVELSIAELPTVPLPAIAHIKNKTGQYFVLIQKIENNNIIYTLADGQPIKKEQLDSFEKKWTGYLLLTEAAEGAGSLDFDKNQKEEKWKRIRKWVLIASITLLVIIPIFIFQGLPLFLLLLKFVGLGLSIILLMKELGMNNLAVNKFCQKIKNGNCDSVMNSAAAKIFGGISLSELGAWYFAGGMLSIALAYLSNSITLVLPILLVLSIFAFLFSFFSIYYQWRVVKKWCSLCLLVQAVFWLELFSFVFFKQYHFENFLNLTLVYILLISLTIPALIWFLFKPTFKASIKAKQLSKNLKRWQKDKMTFAGLIDRSKSIENDLLEMSFVLGNPTAKHRLILLSHFYCKHCKDVHALVPQVKDWYEDISIEFRFSLNPKDEKTSEIAQHLFSIYKIKGREEALLALSAWYNILNIEKWKSTFPIENQEVEASIETHQNWFAKTKINYAPAIILNGKLVPKYYDLKKVLFFAPHFDSLLISKEMVVLESS